MSDHSSAFNFEWIVFILADKNSYKTWMSLDFVKIPSPFMELAPLEHLKKIMNNVMTTLAPSFFSGSSSFFQVTRTTIKA